MSAAIAPAAIVSATDLGETSLKLSMNTSAARKQSTGRIATTRLNPLSIYYGSQLLRNLSLPTMNNTDYHRRAHRGRGDTVRRVTGRRGRVSGTKGPTTKHDQGPGT